MASGITGLTGGKPSGFAIYVNSQLVSVGNQENLKSGVHEK